MSDFFQAVGILALLASYIFFMISCIHSWFCPERSQLDRIVADTVIKTMDMHTEEKKD